MKYTIANLTVLGCFAALVCFGYGRAYVPPLAHTVIQRPAAEQVVLWRPDRAAKLHAKQAAVLAKVFGITAQNVNADIFGGDQ